jgi:hypothetical protein
MVLKINLQKGRKKLAAFLFYCLNRPLCSPAHGPETLWKKRIIIK